MHILIYLSIHIYIYIYLYMYKHMCIGFIREQFWTKHTDHAKRRAAPKYSQALKFHSLISRVTHSKSSGVLQCVAVCCSVLLRVAVCCRLLQMKQCVATATPRMHLPKSCDTHPKTSGVLQCVAACCSVLLRVADCCRLLLCVAVCCRGTTLITFV